MVGFCEHNNNSLSVSKTVYVASMRNDKVIMNSELVRTWQEAVMPYFIVLSNLLL